MALVFSPMLHQLSSSSGIHLTRGAKVFNINLNPTNLQLPEVKHPKASSLRQHQVLLFLNHPDTASVGAFSPYHLQEILPGQLKETEYMLI